MGAMLPLTLNPKSCSSFHFLVHFSHVSLLNPALCGVLGKFGVNSRELLSAQFFVSFLLLQELVPLNPKLVNPATRCLQGKTSAETWTKLDQHQAGLKHQINRTGGSNPLLQYKKVTAGVARPPTGTCTEVPVSPILFQMESGDFEDDVKKTVLPGFLKTTCPI